MNLNTFHRSDLLPWSYKCDEYSRCVKGIVVEVGEGRIQGEDAYGEYIMQMWTMGCYFYFYIPRSICQMHYQTHHHFIGVCTT